MAYLGSVNATRQKRPHHQSEIELLRLGKQKGSGRRLALPHGAFDSIPACFSKRASLVLVGDLALAPCSFLPGGVSYVTIQYYHYYSRGRISYAGLTVSVSSSLPLSTKKTSQNVSPAGIMADDETKKPSIPAWQQANNTESTPSVSETPSQTSDHNDMASRSALLEQAAKFLEDDSIKNEATGRKIAFLESKGLQGDEIESLLGVLRNVEASSNNDTTASTSTDNSDNEKPSNTENASVSSVLQESQVLTPSTSSPPSPAPSSSSSSTTQSSPRDVPPIITYPEFLTKQPKPPPLVSINSIIYTLYGALGLGASMYGASEYLVKPMIANLTSARHDFAQNTKQNLRKLNEKLEQNVSVVPPELATRAGRGSEDFDRDDDLDSITSDPAELFHRDIGTQTTPQDITPPASEDKPTEEKPSPNTTVTNHISRLENINSQLREVASTEEESTTQDDNLRSSLRDMHYYLDSLIYSSPTYSTGYGSWSSTSDSTNGSAMGVAKSEEDAISGFRSEIRGVKGALLSAKNFPTSRGRVGGISTSR